MAVENTALMAAAVEAQPYASRETKFIELFCGRRLAYAEHGDLTGEPVIFFPGAGFGRTTVPSVAATEVLSARNVRFIVPDRPGYGESTVSPGRTLKQWANDVAQLMSALELPKARFLAHSAGTVHLLAVAAYRPELIANMVLVCPISPLHGDRPSEGCARGLMRYCLLHCFCLLGKMVQVQLRRWMQQPQSYLDATRKQLVSAPEDRAFIRDNSKYFETVYLADFESAVKPPSGDVGMMADMFDVNRQPWGFELADIRSHGVRIDVWYGAEDDVAPNGRWMAEQLGGGDHCAEGCGHALIYTQFTRILDCLLSQDLQ